MRGYRQSHSRILPSLRILPCLRLFSSADITPHLRYYEPIRYPDNPVPSSLITSLVYRTIARASRVATSLILHTCQRHYPGGNTSVHLSLASQCAIGLLPNNEESASALLRLEACSTFTRVPARMFAESSKTTR